MKHDPSSSNSHGQTFEGENTYTHAREPELTYIETRRSETKEVLVIVELWLLLQKKKKLLWTSQSLMIRVWAPLYWSTVVKHMIYWPYEVLPEFWLWHEKFSSLYSYFRLVFFVNGWDTLDGLVLLIRAIVKRKWNISAGVGWKFRSALCIGVNNTGGSAFTPIWKDTMTFQHLNI